MYMYSHLLIIYGKKRRNYIYMYMYIIFIASLSLSFSLRSFATPPPQVKMVCECVAIFKGVKDPDWKAAKGLMADTNFLSSLQNMDVDGISASQVRDRERQREKETEKEREKRRD